jgi:hypothetical protein
MWQASLDCGLDDVRGEECERQGHPDRTVGLALSKRERLQSLKWIGQKFVEPAMVWIVGSEIRPLLGAHQVGIVGRVEGASFAYPPAFPSDSSQPSSLAASLNLFP